MTDAEYLFRSHERETKRIARGSYNRKCGSKSRKCALPQDHMTKGELKKLNGKVKTYNTSSKMKWKEFTEMPADLQIKYLKTLKNVYFGRQQDIADMFGIQRQSLANYICKHKLDIKFRRGATKPSEVWLNFINGEATEQETESVEETPVIEKVSVAEEPKQVPTLDTDFKVENITYRAVGNPLVVFAQIAKLIEPGTKYRVNVDIWEVKESCPDTIPF